MARWVGVWYTRLCYVRGADWPVGRWVGWVGADDYDGFSYWRPTRFFDETRAIVSESTQK